MKTEEQNKQECVTLPEESIETEIQLEFSPRVLEILTSLEECFSQKETAELVAQPEPICC